MNHTEIWIDNLDGDFMACNFDNGFAEGYEFACSYVSRFAASVCLLNAFTFFYNAHEQMKLSKQFNASLKKEGTNKTSNVTTDSRKSRPKSGAKVRSQPSKLLSHGVKLALTVGTTSAAGAGLLFVSANSTAFPIGDVRGHIGDAFSESIMQILPNEFRPITLIPETL
jgi:hypothetical protein